MDITLPAAVVISGDQKLYPVEPLYERESLSYLAHDHVTQDEDHIIISDDTIPVFDLGIEHGLKIGEVSPKPQNVLVAFVDIRTKEGGHDSSIPDFSRSQTSSSLYGLSPLGLIIFQTPSSNFFISPSSRENSNPE
jgi:hypothetical protein